jgi:hypothetical protein
VGAAVLAAVGQEQREAALFPQKLHVAEVARLVRPVARQDNSVVKEPKSQRQQAKSA